MPKGITKPNLHRYREDSARRCHSLDHALTYWLSECRRSEGSDDANAFWLQTPQGISIPQLTWLAAHLGMFIEPGKHHFLGTNAPEPFFRLGFHAIAPNHIEPGIIQTAQALHQIAG